jgi:hypothetical protein
MPLLPSGRSLYINAPLTNISVGWQQSPLARSYVADSVFPIVPVQQQGGIFWKYKQEDWFRGQAELRAPATESVGGGWDVEQDTYFADVYAVHKDLADQDRANASSMFNLERDATIWVTQNLLQKRETLFTSSFMTTSVWTGSSGTNGGAAGTDLTGAASGTAANTFIQFDAAGADPIGLIAAQSIGMAKRTGLRPNTLIMGPNVFNALMQNTSIIERIKYSERGIISEELLRTVLNVDRLFVTWGIQTTSNYGAASPTYNFISADSMLLCYSAPNPGLMQPTAGYIFTWAGFLGAQAYGTRIKRFRMEAIESDRIEGEMAFDMKVIDPRLGIFFADATTAT